MIEEAVRASLFASALWATGLFRSFKLPVIEVPACLIEPAGVISAASE
jgi:hypothetical protein